jgi:hypothetical protein
MKISYPNLKPFIQREDGEISLGGKGNSSENIETLGNLILQKLFPHISFNDFFFNPKEVGRMWM